MKKHRLDLKVCYEKPDKQANYYLVAQILRKHADDIVMDPNTGKIGERKYSITTTHGTAKVSISWEMHTLDST